LAAPFGGDERPAALKLYQSMGTEDIVCDRPPAPAIDTISDGVGEGIF